MNNDKLAFDITIDGLVKYAKKCAKDPVTKTMNPIEGSYLMTNSLATALLYKAEDNLTDCRQLMIEAIDDALEKVKGVGSVDE